MFSVYVEFHLKAVDLKEFTERVKTNARISLEKEAGCIQFDVCQDNDQPNVIWLYEVYDSRRDFDEHLASTHFQSFSAETSAMVVEKKIRCGNRLGQ